MFTGLIEAVGRLEELNRTSRGVRIRIRTRLAADMAPGDSLAVNGVCLTVAIADAEEVHADIGPETLRVTTLGSLSRDRPLNLERPLRADARLGGHFVQGHVDGTGIVEEIREDGDSHWVTIAFSRELAPYLIRKGSIAIDGISLTVAGLGERQLDVMIIPETWKRTNMSALRAGDRVNLECDMLGKYVVRAVERAAAGTGRVAEET